MVFTRRDLLRAAIAALGVISVLLLWLMAPVVSPTHGAIYHWSGSPLRFFAPPILEFCVFWLALTLLLTVTTGRLRLAVWCAALGLTPWMTLKNWVLLRSGPSHPELNLVLLGLGLAAFLVPLVIWRPRFERESERAVQIIWALLALSATSGAGILLGCAEYGWQARSLNAGWTARRGTDFEPQAGRPRVIWIILDELSYQQVYERRYPGLMLPSFDSIAEEATVFTHTVPAGFMTEEVVPSLMTGETVDGFRSSADGRLSMHHPGSKGWEPFDEHNTVFQDALNLKYNTAVAGWYNPYCRILPNVLDTCFWSSSVPTSTLLMPQETFGRNLIAPWTRFFPDGVGSRVISAFLKEDEMETQTKGHLLDYQELADAANRILDDRTAGFALLHMPIPHPPGILDRRSGRLTVKHSSYLDNLVLADQFLGEVRSRLEKSGQWDSSTIVIMGDHSWRAKQFWNALPDWTEEERVASGGNQWDDRPGYVVKLAEQKTGSRIDTPFDAANTRKLLDALLAQSIRSKEDLFAWVMKMR